MYLYHGSAYKHTLLSPGIKHTGELVTWDNHETNEWLYLTSDYKEACSLGFASAIEKHYPLYRYKTSRKGELIDILLYEGQVPTLAELAKIDVYVYRVLMQNKCNIIKNDNTHKNLSTEYKTTETIRPLSCEKIDLHQWLKKHIVIIGLKPTSPLMQSALVL